MRAHGNSTHTPPLAVIIVNGGMLGAAIIPERHGPRMPVHPARKCRLDHVVLQKLDDWATFLSAEALDMGAMGTTDIERLGAGIRVGADHWVLRFDLRGLIGAVDRHAANGAMMLAAAAGVFQIGIVNHDQAIKHGFHTIRQSVICRRCIGEKRITAKAWRFQRI